VEAISMRPRLFFWMLLAARPGSARIPEAARWLMGNRTGKAWACTKSSAEAVFALTAYMERTKELQPDFRARVTLDGQTLREFTATRANVFDAPVTVTLTPEQWQGHTGLRLDKQGAGTLYATMTYAYALSAEKSQPMSKGITVRRFYRITAEDPSQADTVASGADIEVEVEVTADTNYRYAILEAPIPAGCEVAPTEDDSGRFAVSYAEGVAGFARQEVRDDKVVFFFNDLPRGRARLTYRLHAETPGVYRVLPGIASLMYFPEVRGNTGLVTAKIGERK
jgi:uncharacterized protein YfaS (alpha-2-macroglobulin family)